MTFINFIYIIKTWILYALILKQSIKYKYLYSRMNIT